MQLSEFILLENFKDQDYQGWLYTQPVDELRVDQAHKFNAVLEKIQAAQKKGLHLAGYINYEAGFLLQPKLNSRLQLTSAPLLHFLIFKKRQAITRQQRENIFAKIPKTELPLVLYNFNFEMQRNVYLERFAKLQEHLKAGDTYQVNFTSRYEFDLQGSTWEFYNKLCERQRVTFSGYLKFSDYAILSLSPELFFRKIGDKIHVCPMKGTAARNSDLTLDQAAREFLATDTKNKAENIIIVDLLRNDLSRIAKTGSVGVVKLCSIEDFETVYQMTSTIEAKIDPNISFKTMLQALFPCGSITGAPKIRTMEIIQDLEVSPREIYTGAIGFITPDNDMCFNVAIRSLYLKNNHAVLGVGGGITIHSEGEGEWEEMHLKANFLTRLSKDFSLIETLAWTREKGYLFFENHLLRLVDSARNLSFICKINKIKHDLLELISQFSKPAYRIRLVLNSNGKYEISFFELESAQNHPVNIALSVNSINENNILFQYKTTHASTRGFYQSELARIQEKNDVFEVIFQNREGFITEGTRFNLMIDINGKMFTPSVKSGLLPGVYRQYLLDQKDCQEREITSADLQAAQQIFLINSVRGLIPAKFVGIK